jgi:hypothetical protein
MRLNLRALVMFFLFSLVLSFHVPRATAADWDPVTDAEKAMKTNPLDPGAGAVVLFKRGEIDVLEKGFWTTKIRTYTRIKVFTDAGRDAANISVDAPKYIRLSKIEGRTILPTGEIIPLDSSKVFRGKAYEAGKNFAVLETSFTFPSVAPGAIIEYQMEEDVSTRDPVRFHGHESPPDPEGTLRAALSRPGHHDDFCSAADGLWQRSLPDHREMGRRGHGSNLDERHGEKLQGSQEQNQGAHGQRTGSPKKGRSHLQVHPAEHHLEQYLRRGPGADCR